MEKIIIDWKVPSEVKMKEVVKKLDNDKKKAFAQACIEVKNNKNTIIKGKAKQWLVDNCSELIEWKNKPQNAKTISSADEIASWLNL